MPLNLSGADKTLRRYAAVEGANHPAVDPTFVHEPPPGDALSPESALAFTATAAGNLLTSAGHGLAAGTPVRFSTTDTLPAGFALAITYYVIAAGLTADAFKVSATLGGAEVDITTAGTGVHSWRRYLTAPEEAEVTAWRSAGYGRDEATALYAALTPAAKLMADALIAYWFHPQHLAWIIDDRLERHWQWIYRSADHADAAQTAISPSADIGGAGTPPPDSPADPSPN